MELDFVTWAVGGALSAGVAFGIVKTQLHNKVGYEQHREMCRKEREESNRVAERVFDKLDDCTKMISEIHGYLKAKNGGNL